MQFLGILLDAYLPLMLGNAISVPSLMKIPNHRLIHPNFFGGVSLVYVDMMILTHISQNLIYVDEKYFLFHALAIRGCAIGLSWINLTVSNAAWPQLLVDSL
jgi:hypothetical protein